MLVHLILSQRSLKLSSILLILSLLYLYSSVQQSYFHNSVFQLTYPFFCLSYSAIDPPRVVFISVIYYPSVLVYSLFLLGPCLSVLIVFCIFSILFSGFWNIFTIITLDYFSGSLPVSSSFIWSCEFLPCSFSFLCLFIFIFNFF